MPTNPPQHRPDGPFRRILRALWRRPDSRRQQRWKLIAESFARHR